MFPVPDDFYAVFKPLADQQRAQPMRAYMKQHFSFFGIPTPARRLACKPLLAALKQVDEGYLLSLATALWEYEERECQYAAIDVLARYANRLSPAALPQLLTLAQQKSWWDSVDGLAGVVGDLLRMQLPQHAGIQQSMDTALMHDNFWIRRIAMLHQLGWKAGTDTHRLFGYALQLAAEEEFFIRKASGWALRDYAWHDPEAVRTFLKQHGSRLSSLTCREASKNLHRL